MDLLRTHDDFRRLWTAQTLSQIGSQVTYLALPLTAAVALSATPAQMGVLVAMGGLPALVVGLVAGDVVDRHPRRPLLVSTDLARAALLLLIPLAWLSGSLGMPLLYAVAFLVGVCGLFFDVAYQALVPSLLDRRKLVAGNGLLELSRSAAEVVGPVLAGGLVQVVKAPLAIAADACSFLASAVLVARIRVQEPARGTANDPDPVWRSAFAGVRAIGRSAPLRALALTLAVVGLFNAVIEAVAILYLARSVGLAPGWLGLVFAVGSVGFVVGALIPTRLVARLGVGPTLAVAVAVVGLSDLLLPLSGQDVRWAALAFGVGQFFFGLGLTVFRVAQVSIRQALVPDALLGRVGGAFNVVGWGIAPLGALVGGVLGQAIGLWWTLVVGSLGEAAAAVLIVCSPLWTLRELPTIGEDGE
jgi:MFS family permease